MLDDSARLNQAEAALPICPRLREPSPEGGQSRAVGPAVEDQELVSQGEVFEEKYLPGLQTRESNREHEFQPTDHRIKDS